MKIERLRNSPNFVDEDGNIRSNADLRPDMEAIDYGAPAAALRSLAAEIASASKESRTGRRGTEPVYGAEASRLIADAQADEESRLGRTLSDEELKKIARAVEQREHGL